jgi:hypothetical protein
MWHRVVFPIRYPGYVEKGELAWNHLYTGLDVSYLNVDVGAADGR